MSVKEGKKDYVDLIRQGRQNGWNISYFPVEVGARGVLSESLGAFFRFMGLARRKASQAADNVGRVGLQASYTLWLSRNQPKFSRWTLVEKPQLGTAATASQQSGPKPVSNTPRDLGSDEGAARAATERPPPTYAQVVRGAPSSTEHERGNGQTVPQQGNQKPLGLINLGNTCFVNATAQCLMATQSLVSTASPAIVRALTKLKATPVHIIRPTELIEAISQLRPSLTSGSQQDAAEALEVMLTPNTNQNPPSVQAPGEIADVISCVTCGSRSLMKSSLCPPILRIPVTAPSLDLCLADFLTPQPLSGRRCGECHAVSSEISTEILATPQAMAIHLLRFAQDTQVHKNTSSVTFTPSIFLDGASWHVTGIINHMGTLQQGHYNAYVRHHHRWFRCDDSRVTEITAETVFSSGFSLVYADFAVGIYNIPK